MEIVNIYKTKKLNFIFYVITIITISITITSMIDIISQRINHKINNLTLSFKIKNV